MNYENFVSGLPRERRMTFTSAEENQEVMERLGVNQAIRQLGTGVFRADMCVRSTRQAELFSDRFSKAFSLNLQSPAGVAGFLIPRSASGKFISSGQDIGNDQLVFLPDGADTDIVAPDLAGSESFCIPMSRFIELAEALCPSMRPLDQMSAIKGDTSRLHILRKWILKLNAQQAEPDEEQLSDLIASTISWMIHSVNKQACNDRIKTISRKQRIAKTAQDVIHAEFRENVQIEDICVATGVGVRTLQRCFSEYFDVSISEYLKAVRLDSAQRQLAAREPSQTRITDVALECGFKHLGRFSTEFHHHYGLLPSEMMRKTH